MTRANRTIARALAVAALAVPALAQAQIFEVRRKSSDPMLVGSLGVGFFRTQAVRDGTTGSTWIIDDGAQYRGSLEYAMKGGSTLGVVGTHARLPLRYVSDALCPPPGDAATRPCGDFEGEVTVQSLWGTFHGGGAGVGLHGVLDAGLGYTWYRDFEAEGDPALDALEPDRDFSFFIGTGFGYGITRRLSVDLVQDFIISRHQGENLSPDVSKTAQQRTTRLTVRYGFGSRRAGI